jgi:hypothetical protein
MVWYGMVFLARKGKLRQGIKGMQGKEMKVKEMLVRARKVKSRQVKARYASYARKQN